MMFLGKFQKLLKFTSEMMKMFSQNVAFEKVMELKIEHQILC